MDDRLAALARLADVWTSVGDDLPLVALARLADVWTSVEDDLPIVHRAAAYAVADTVSEDVDLSVSFLLGLARGATIQATYTPDGPGPACPVASGAVAILTRRLLAGHT